MEAIKTKPVYKTKKPQLYEVCKEGIIQVQNVNFDLYDRVIRYTTPEHSEI